MDIIQSIEDIFGVFGVGIFALLCIYTLYGIAYCKIESIVKFYKNFLPATSTNSTLHSGVCIAVAGIFIFGFGLIVQDTADKYTDTTVSGKKNDRNIIVQINNQFKILKNESDHRFSALVKEENGTLKLHPLGKSVFKHTGFLFPPNHNLNDNQKKFLEQILFPRELPEPT
jgi:hypothetical protein